MTKVSIVIPVYNTKNYVENCLKSCLSQTHKDIEIVVVDDGSKDNSLQICQRIASNDKRIKVFSKSNEGVSSARNFGLMKASGDYVCFVDSDDTIDRDFVERLLDEAKTKKCDIVFCRYDMVYSDKIVLTFNYKDGTKTVSLADVNGSDLKKTSPPE